MTEARPAGRPRGAWRGSHDPVAGTIRMTFHGHLDERSGVESAVWLADLLRTDSRQTSWRLECDVRTLSGYDSGARIAWQRTLFPVRARIGAIVMVGGNALVRMAAATVGLFLGVAVHDERSPG